ncbi:MAG: hypothetical protein KDA45_08825 [Planctomycetales bacterium]|nr:hypothetical protein [Planctomycetales bacterium]
MRRLFLPLAMACLCVSLPAHRGRAQASNTASFVTRSVQGRAILNVDAKLELPPGRALGILRATVSSKTPSVADRHLVLVYYLKPFSAGSRGSFAYHVPLRLAEGSREVTVEVPHVPQDSLDQGVWEVVLYEGGRDIKDKQQRANNQGAPQWLQYDSSSLANCAALSGSGEAIDAVRQTLARLAALQQPQQGNLGPAVAPTGPTWAGSVQVLPLTEASEDWRRYFPYASWSISATTLQELCGRYPARAAALRKYVAAGGVLLIHGADQPPHLSAVQDFLSPNAASPPPAEWSSVQTPQQRWWLLSASEEVAPPSTAPLKLDGLAMVHDAALVADSWLQARWGGHLSNGEAIAQQLGAETTLNDSLLEIRDNLLAPLSTEKLLVHDHLFGKVLLASQPLEQLPWRLLEQTEFPYNPTLVSISSDADGNWFWRNLIQAVGKPPVWIFCGMVALFGGLLGPGLLIFTGRMQRRSLMIFLVPLISLFATGAIIAYGILHEGFETHIRLTSVQIIAPDGQLGFVWSRQNYFSGLPPREGLIFEADTYARPVYAEQASGFPGDSNPRRGVSCNVSLQGQQQWRGWLRPRQQQQLLVGQAMKTIALPIAIEPSGQSPPAAPLRDATLRQEPLRQESRTESVTFAVLRNLTSAALPLVVFRGAADDYYFYENLDAGQRVVLASAERAAVAEKISQAVVDYRPQLPPELDNAGSLLNFGTGRRAAVIGLGGGDDLDVVNTTFRRSMSDQFELPPFGFAVLARESAAVQLPLAGTSSENLHLIRGEQPW